MEGLFAKRHLLLRSIMLEILVPVYNPIAKSMPIISRKVQAQLKGHPKIKNIIVVASGKGGVGKSTTSVNLAVALQALGYSVGILDADIYGPSIPKLMNTEGEPEIIEKRIQPMMQYEITTISIGNLVDLEAAVAWRGPMVSRALQQLLQDTDWPELDFLMVDLPPGTGDIQLTIAQKIPVAGAVIVTTPQDLALLDARRAISMFNKVDIAVLGIVENMSYFECPQCGHQEAIFAEGGGEHLASEMDVPMLGHIPLATAIRLQADDGKPIALTDNGFKSTYCSIAENLLHQLSLRPKDYGRNMPNVVVE